MTVDIAVSGGASPATIVVIEPRIFVQECLAHCFRLFSGDSVACFPSVQSFLAVTDISVSVIILSAHTPVMAVVRQQLSLLTQAQNHVPAIVLNDQDDPKEIMAALESGARGYIPTSLPLQLAIEAMRLVRAGGTFVPASSLVAMRQTNQAQSSEATKSHPFTVRQAAVVEVLCRGKANKIIAHELNMRESTVKVHVHNIMKKLKARNRTEVAFIVSNMMHSESWISSQTPASFEQHDHSKSHVVPVSRGVLSELPTTR